MADQTFGPGVFSRNHIKYLRRANGRRVYFRSQKRWSGAQELLEKGDTKIYFCPIPGDGRIHYAGKLVALELDPSLESLAALVERTKARSVAPSEEKLWDDTVQTIYVVEVEQLSSPFSMSDLQKLSNDEPLSEDYGYSYSLVRRVRPANP